MSRPAKRPAVFIDRDGTIVEDVGYLSDPDGLILINGAAEALKLLNDEGVKVIVITNQSGVGRGYYPEAAMRAVNERLEEMLAGEGARVDGIYCCTHRPDEGCGCRKPATGLVEAATDDHSIDVSLSYVVGDKATDVELAARLKAKGVLVMTGKGPEEALRPGAPASYEAGDILGAVRWIIEDIRRGRDA
jgi:histidinol-phosphate phosphatase family protein